MRTKAEQEKAKATDRRLAKGFGQFLEDKKGRTKKKVRAKKESKANREARHDEEHKTIARAAKAAGRRSLDRTKERARGSTTTDKGARYLDKAIRKAMKLPAPPKNPYAALMEPMVIVPIDSDEKVVIADAGSIVKLLDQATLYRDWISPITRRADELLVQYGKAEKPKRGWLTNKQPSTIMKPSSGPTFLVTTRSENELVAWEQLRLKIARTRKNDPTNWVAPWLANNGSKHQSLLREVTKYFGGKPIKNEGLDARCIRLFSLILNTELDMATAKSSKSKAKKGSKNAKAEKAEKSVKSGKASKSTKTKTKNKKGNAEKAVASDRLTAKQDDYIIRRLIKENPRRAGTDKAKVWDKLKKGMTVAEFVAKGGARSVVSFYIRNGWVKLLRSKDA